MPTYNSTPQSKLRNSTYTVPHIDSQQHITITSHKLPNIRYTIRSHNITPQSQHKNPPICGTPYRRTRAHHSHNTQTPQYAVPHSDAQHRTTVTTHKPPICGNPVRRTTAHHIQNTQTPWGNVG